ncbi:MAG: RNA-binding S4 domain-containing protein [Flavobacterium sp.]|jgi:ribosome-associated heat shock protein Hsp15
MRIDKYLWCVRYYKTRNIAAEAIKKNQITVNGNIAKPSKEIAPSDVITIKRDQIYYQLKVIEIPKNRVAAKIVDCYRIDTTTPEELAKLEQLKLNRTLFDYQGEGRPTKKDRRSIDEFLDVTDQDEGWD